MGRSSVVTFKSKRAQLCRRGYPPLLDSLRFKIELIFNELSISMPPFDHATVLLLGGLISFVGSLSFVTQQRKKFPLPNEKSLQLGIWMGKCSSLLSVCMMIYKQ